MQSRFAVHETLEVVTNDVHGLAKNAIDTQRVYNKEAKKKDCKTVFYIQSAVDTMNLIRFLMLNRGRRHEIFVSSIMKEVRRL